MTSNPQYQGWQWPKGCAKFHYFNGEDRSLCRTKTATVGKPFYSGAALPPWWRHPMAGTYPEQCQKCKVLING